MEGASKMNFPLLKSDGNSLSNKKGEVSFVYKFLPLDFEQLDYDTLCTYYTSVKYFLGSLNDKDYIRIYKIDGEAYLVTSIKDFNFPRVVLGSPDDPLSFYLGSSEIFSDIKFGDDYLVFNGKYHKFINIREFPSEISENHLGEIGLDFILSFRKMSEMKQRSFIEVKDGSYKGKKNQSKSKIELSKADSALSVIEEIADAISKGEEALFKTEAWIIVSDISKEVLFNKVTAVFQTLLTHKLYLESIALSEVFVNNFPGVTPIFSNDRSLIKHTSFIASLIPLSKDKLMNEGFELFSKGGERLYFDIKNRSFKNKNTFVAGPTGSGKSLLVQHMIENYLINGENIIVLDKGESYKKLCLYYDGLLLDTKINFLTFKNAQYLTDFVLEVAGKDEFSKIGKGELFDWIECGIKNNLFHTHDEFINYLEEKFNKIKYYFSDIKHFFCDDIINYLDQKFVYCEVKKYPPKLRGPVILFLFQFFEHFKGDVTFVFEEIHNYLLTTPDSIVGTISREIRKEGGALVGVTQSVNDILLYPLLNVLWENTQHKFLFQHETEPSETYIKGHARDLFLSITENTFKNNNEYKSEKKDHSEFLLNSDGFNKVVRLYVTKDKYELYTSDPEDQKNFNNWMSLNSTAFSDFKEAIHSYTRIKYEI
jgi:energy-coupling factor transporter ATP-binding protein EcfA2